MNSLFRSSIYTSRPIKNFLLQNKSFSNVTAGMVKELREKSGAPMMDCKKALASPEVAGDLAKAIDWLRAKGIAKAQSNSNRAASEGLIAVIHSNLKSTILEINSETDFVARNSDFQELVYKVAQVANQKFDQGKVSVDSLLEMSIEGSGEKVSRCLTDSISKIRENIIIRRIENFVSNESTHLGIYVHSRVDTKYSDIDMGTAAAVVSLSHDSNILPENSVKLFHLSKKLAMHIVASKPQYLDKQQVSPEVLNQELAIIKELTLKEANGKPQKEQIFDKIIAGKLNKRLTEICLLEQNHMAEEGSPVIKKFLEQNSKVLNSKLNISNFTVWTLGSVAK